MRVEDLSFGCVRLHEKGGIFNKFRPITIWMNISNVVDSNGPPDLFRIEVTCVFLIREDIPGAAYLGSRYASAYSCSSSLLSAGTTFTSPCHSKTLGYQ
jgi:hypothetical protein